MKSKITQRDRIEKYLNEHGSITQAEADTLKIKRLAARIDDMRKAGENIICEMVKGKNEYGVYYCGRYRRA